MTLIYLLLLLILVLFPSFYYIFMFQNKKPNQPPSPPKLPIIGNLHQLGKFPHRALQTLSQKHGPIMLLHLGNSPTIIISSSELAKQVLKTHDLECCSRPSLEGPRKLSYTFLDIIFSPYSEYWKEMKKICVMELFNSMRVKSFASIREEEIGSLIDYISTQTTNPINLSEKINELLFTIIGKIACGENEKFFEEGRLMKVVKEAMGMLGSFSAADFFPYVGWIVDVISGLHARREKSFHQFDVFYQKVIDEHLDPQRPVPENEDIVDILLRLMKTQSDANGLTFDHIKAVLMNIFLGGTDTSSVTIIWAMTELMKNPRVMKKLQTEIRTYVGNINKPFVENVGENLKYLNMVIKETLRLHPPAVLLVPHLARKHIQLGGYDVYPNTRIQINAFAIGRDPNSWKHPEEFYPERFENVDIDFGGQDFNLIPFGAGRRICPGMSMACTNIEFVVVNLLYHFDWKLPNNEEISMEEGVTINVYKKDPLCLVPIKIM